MPKPDLPATPPPEAPATGTSGPHGAPVADTTRAVGNAAQGGPGSHGSGSSDWLAEAHVGGPGTVAEGEKGPPMRSTKGGADRAGHTEESKRGQY